MVVGLGEALWDCLPEGRKLGGAPANFAYHVSQFGIPSAAVSAVGEDELGAETLGEFDKKHLSYVMPRVDKPTGTVQVTLDEAGVPQYEIKTGVAWDNIPFIPEIEELAKHCRCVCYGSLAQRSEVSRDTIRRFVEAVPADCLKVFDINLRQQFYSKELIADNLKRCDVLKINDEELDTVSRLFGIGGTTAEESSRQLVSSYSLQMLVLTCGTHGSYVFTPSDTSFLPTPKVQVADTVGAGDSFTGALVAALLTGHDIKFAHTLAVNASAYVCTQDGAMPELPDSLKRI